MTPRGYMAIGAMIGAGALGTSFAVHNPDLTMLAWVGGVLFGKGYGVWEGRKP